MGTEVDIANSALMMLGQRPIQSLDDPSDSALACKICYAANRDALLREYPWNFARKQMALNALATAPINLDLLPNNHGPGSILYTIAFAAPTDILRLYRWAPEYTHWRLVSGTPFGFQGLAVITDAIPAPNNQSLNGTQPGSVPSVTYIPALSQVGCEYIARIEDPDLFDSMFVDVLISSIARDIAFTMTGLESLMDRMEKSYQDAKLNAAAVNGMEQTTDQLYDTTIADVRYGYSGLWYNS